MCQWTKTSLSPPYQSEVQMNIYAQEGWAYVKMGPNMLCIGTTDEIDKADVAKVGQMVIEALATAKFHAIKYSWGQKLH